MEKNLHISGVGGWLGILVVGLMVFGPLGEMSTYGNELLMMDKLPQLANNAQHQNFMQVYRIILMVLVPIQFTAGYRLWKIHSPASVQFAILVIWLGPLGSVLLKISEIIILDGNASSFSIGEVLIPTVIVAGVWTTYLRRSVRVRNTYKIPQPNASAIPLDSEAKCLDESVDREQREAWSIRLLNRFDPFRCTTKFTQRLSVSLLIISLLLWVVWVSVESDGFSRVEPLGWFIFFGVPIVAYIALLVALPILRKVSQSKDSRFLLSASIMWIFLIGAWGYIWHWQYIFDNEEYLALFILPLIGVWLGFFLWKWSKAG